MVTYPSIQIYYSTSSLTAHFPAISRRLYNRVNLTSISSYCWASGKETANTGPSEAGRLGRPEPPHFSPKEFILTCFRFLIQAANHAHPERSEACPHVYLHFDFPFVSSLLLVSFSFCVSQPNVILSQWKPAAHANSL